MLLHTELAGQSPVKMSLGPLASRCESASCAYTGKYHLFGLACVYNSKIQNVVGIRDVSNSNLSTPTEKVDSPPEGVYFNPTLTFCYVSTPAGFIQSIPTYAT